MKRGTGSGEDNSAVANGERQLQKCHRHQAHHMFKVLARQPGVMPPNRVAARAVRLKVVRQVMVSYAVTQHTAPLAR